MADASKNYPNGIWAVRIGGRLKQNIDGWSRVRNGRLGGQGEMPAFHQQVIVCRRKIDMPRQNRSLVLSFLQRHSAMLLQELRKGLGANCSMQANDHGGGESIRE